MDFIKILSKKGEIITELKGCIAPMTKEQQREILVEGKGSRFHFLYEVI